MERDELLQNDSKGYTAGSENPVGSLIRYVFVAFGIFFVGIGAVGTVVPLIPTTPLIILAAVCFGKSSPRLHALFVSTGFYKKSVSRFVQSRSMTIKAKIVLLSSITIFMGLSFTAMIFLNAPLIAKLVLLIIWLCHVIYFGFKVKTAS